MDPPFIFTNYGFSYQTPRISHEHFFVPASDPNQHLYEELQKKYDLLLADHQTLL